MPAFLSLSARVSVRVSVRVFVRAFFMVCKVSPVAAEFYSGCGGVLFRLRRSFVPVVAEFYSGCGGVLLMCSLTFLVDYFQS